MLRCAFIQVRDLLWEELGVKGFYHSLSFIRFNDDLFNRS